MRDVEPDGTELGSRGGERLEVGSRGGVATERVVASVSAPAFGGLPGVSGDADVADVVGVAPEGDLAAAAERAISPSSRSRGRGAASRLWPSGSLPRAAASGQVSGSSLEAFASP